MSTSFHGSPTHFSIISKIDVRGPPVFWRKVLSSCPALVTAENGHLSLHDIFDGESWLCTALGELRLELKYKAVESECFEEFSSWPS